MNLDLIRRLRTVRLRPINGHGYIHADDCVSFAQTIELGREIHPDDWVTRNTRRRSRGCGSRRRSTRISRHAASNESGDSSRLVSYPRKSNSPSSIATESFRLSVYSLTIESDGRLIHAMILIATRHTRLLEYFLMFFDNIGSLSAFFSLRLKWNFGGIW